VARHQDSWKRAKTIHLSSDASGFKHLRRYLDKFSTQLTDFLILLEPTGGYYALTLLSYLIGEGYTVLQVENKAVKDYREKIFGSETKTDDTDARLMARMGFLHEMVGEEFSIQPVRLTNPDDAALRVMVRDLVKLQKEITRRFNQLQQVVAVTFPELKTFFTTSTARPAVRALLERFPTPQDLSAASPEDVADVLRGARAYSHAKRADELLALAQSSAGVKAIGHHLWRQGWIIQQLPVLEQARAELIQQLRQATAAHPYTPIIESLPVKSPIWTATLIAVIGNVERFSNYGEFKAYMGWYPRVAQSGSSVNSSGLAKKAVRLSRNVLGQMTAVLLAPTVRTTPFREFYERLVARGMKSGTARGHMAGKLAVVIYGMLKTMTAYDEQKHRKALGLPEPAAESAESSVEAPMELVEALDDERDLLGEIA
jgi:transposase